eukprot:8982097-Pyramimonas_sp.AAC.1
MGACIIGADLEGGKWGVAALIAAVYMVLPFNWTGSPGGWMIRAWVAECYYSAYRPADARWDDAVPFLHSSFWMDDQVLVAPDIGARAAQSGATALGAGHAWAQRRSTWSCLLYTSPSPRDRSLS